MVGKLSSFLGSYGVSIAAVGVVVVSAGAYYYQSTTVKQMPVALISPDVAPVSILVAPVSDQTPRIEPAAKAAPALPKFDVVRVEVDGSTLIAGTAVPKSRVIVQVDGKDVAKVEADQGGNFVALFTIEPSDTPRVLTLLMVSKGQEGVVSKDSVVVAPSVLTMSTPPSVMADVQTLVAVEEPAAEIMTAGSENVKEAATQEAATQDTVQEITSEETTPETTPKIENAPAVVAAAQETPDDVITPTSASSEAVTEIIQPEIQTGQDVIAQDVTPPAAPQASPQIQTETVAVATVSPEAIPSETTVQELPPSQVVEQTATASPGPKTPQPPTVLLATDEGIRVLQGPTALQNVVLDSITYDQTGEVQLAGRGAEQGFVRIYLNNAPIQTAQIEESGAWRTPLPDVDTGIYTLRIDQVDEQGTVISRVETPFLRESAAVLETAGQLTQAVLQPAQGNIETPPAQSTPAQAPPKVAVITVQPGSTLWAIAQEKYGDGALYVRVFEANQDNIRNPDLIYPGQVFAVPDALLGDISQ